MPTLEVAATFIKTYRKLISDSENVPLILKNPKFLYNIVNKGEKRRVKNSKKFNIPVPRICIFSVTWECNLKCLGCYAKSYSTSGKLKIDDIYDIAKQVCDLGCFIFIIAGGEPLTIPNLVETLSKITEGFFLVFTNGTLFSDEIVEQLKESKNVFPIISIEGESTNTDERRGDGVSDKISKAMENLLSAKIGFGFSAMATHKNVGLVTSRKWLDKLWEAGARFGFIIDYVPFKIDYDPSLVLTKSDMEFKKLEVAKRNLEMKPLLMNFPPEEYDAEGCKSAGKGLIHINADGFVEPCPFCHYACDNIKEKRLESILASDFFSSIRSEFSKIGFNSTCLLFEHDNKIKEIASRTNATKTDGV
jgi:MoaA/NifB/PqqE/SkfB family radical SAM enzyme